MNTEPNANASAPLPELDAEWLAERLETHRAAGYAAKAGELAIADLSAETARRETLRARDAEELDRAERARNHDRETAAEAERMARMTPGERILHEFRTRAIKAPNGSIGLHSGTTLTLPR